MSYFEGGTAISTGGIALQCEQAVLFDDKLITLSNGELSSYLYRYNRDDGLEEVGAISSLIMQRIAESNLVLEDDTIVEISGVGRYMDSVDNTMKVRYASGIALSIFAPYSGVYVVSEIGKNIARITAHGDYKFENNFYKSGSGTAPLAPLLTLDSETNIVSVFEGVDSDMVVTLDDLSTDKIVGSVAGLPVIGNGASYTVAGNSVSGFGEILFAINKTTSIFVCRKVRLSDGDPLVQDYSNFFSESHYSYVQAYREDWESQWIGYGETGNVVDMGDTVCMRVDVPVEGSYINKTLSFVVVDGALKEIDGSGNLTPIETITLDGFALVDYIYNHDMANTIALKAAPIVEVEPFTMNGFIFGYGSGHWSEVTPST